MPLQYKQYRKLRLQPRSDSGRTGASHPRAGNQTGAPAEQGLPAGPEPIPVEEPETPAVEASGKVIPAERPGLFLNDLLEKKNFSDFRKAFSLNDRFRFRRELFGGDEARMNKVINDLNDLHSYEDSVTYLNNELKWNIEDEAVADFIKLLEKTLPLSNVTMDN